jgi:deazaflavin-dependent oxidoreductase (nitroreductase family)
MANMDPRTEEQLRQLFKRYLNPFMLTMWRLGLGKWFKVWPEISGSIMVLIHTGRKTGIRRYQPLNYAIVDDDIYCVAGFGSVSDWYRNIRANPCVEVWLPDGWWAGVAEDISDSPSRIQLIRQVLMASGFASYLAGLNPLKMTDDELDAESKKYRLLRIHRSTARTGPGGPGDLEWVWQLATMVLVGFLFYRKRRRTVIDAKNRPTNH